MFFSALSFLFCLFFSTTESSSKDKFLQRFFKAGSGSAVKKRLDPNPQKTNADPQLFWLPIYGAYLTSGELTGPIRFSSVNTSDMPAPDMLGILVKISPLKNVNNLNGTITACTVS